MATKPTIKRALISTSDKTGLVELAQQLTSLGIDIIATGGTAQLLSKEKIPVREVADYTGFPEIMDGRVKTLHPKIHAGLLGRRGVDDATMQAHDIHPIDLLIVNLYPFQKTIADPNCTFDNALEQIDIGGPTMLRAAAKNYRDVTVVVDPADYKKVLDELKTQNNTTLETRQELAKKTFAHTAEYDAVIAQYFSQSELFPETYTPTFQKQFDLRYGENPHQKSAFYSTSSHTTDTLAHAKQLQGKPLSFNNMLDSDAALSCVNIFDQKTPTCVIVKHANPCGVAQGATLQEAYQQAYATDPTSSFGGVIAFNQSLDSTTAKTMLEQQFVEVVLAPDIHPDALTELATKPNLRVLTCGPMQKEAQYLTLHALSGGLLLQENDTASVTADDLRVVTKRKPTAKEIEDLLFAWKVVKYVKSNAIVYAKDRRTLGIGAGQASRVFSAKIAMLKAAEAHIPLKDSVMASDAFFPFADSIEVATAAGITAIIQPGGSKRDNEVIEAADKANLAMVLTGIRHFRH